ncbi:hypothetical protein EVAR_20097_1 [Eumeta japonica]|uniref:Uncharacterized protein n=1 Tax=Eumeta variegata TaxID=151549 RepID=A0A4C1V305_EUMVA|nr:hypothetical protein EVAR_20097_1 [Eumeta japonica]
MSHWRGDAPFLNFAITARPLCLSLLGSYGTQYETILLYEDALIEFHTHFPTLSALTLNLFVCDLSIFLNQIFHCLNVSLFNRRQEAATSLFVRRRYSTALKFVEQVGGGRLKEAFVFERHPKHNVTEIPNPGGRGLRGAARGAGAYGHDSKSYYRVMRDKFIHEFVSPTRISAKNVRSTAKPACFIWTLLFWALFSFGPEVASCAVLGPLFDRNLVRVTFGLRARRRGPLSDSRFSAAAHPPASSVPPNN